MGKEEVKSQTQSGMKYLYQYFILTFCFTLALLLSSITLFIDKESWVFDQGSIFSFFVVVFSAAIILLIWFAIGLVNIFNGRRGLDIKHESNVILAAILLIAYMILFLITLAYSKGFMGGRVFIYAAANGFSESIVTLCVTLALSITAYILFGYAMEYLIKEISSDEQKKRLRTAFLLLVAGNFTLDITYLIACFMFFKIYQEIYLSFKEGKIKVAATAPCPNCGRDISIESKSCHYCGAKLEEVTPMEVDPRLNINVPKPSYNLPVGYTPTEGPTEAEKKRVLKIIYTIIAIIVVIAVIYAIYQIVT